MKKRATQLSFFLGVALFAALGLNSLNPTFNPLRFATRTTLSGPVVLERVQKLNRLETARYNGQAIVRGDTGGVLPIWLAGDRMLFEAHGEVVAGVDLSRLQADDVRVENGRVTLHLPPAEILHARLDNTTSEVYARQVGIFSRPDIGLETKVRREAETRIREAALQSGVLATAQQNARAALRELVRALGAEEVEFAA